DYYCYSGDDNNHDVF
nr:immunoglobulin light chain junction region [Macaca mulatta]